MIVHMLMHDMHGAHGGRGRQCKYSKGEKHRIWQLLRWHIAAIGADASANDPLGSPKSSFIMTIRIWKVESDQDPSQNQGQLTLWCGSAIQSKGGFGDGWFVSAFSHVTKEETSESHWTAAQLWMKCFVLPSASLYPRFDVVKLPGELLKRVPDYVLANSTSFQPSATSWCLFPHAGIRPNVPRMRKASCCKRCGVLSFPGQGAS